MKIGERTIKKTVAQVDETQTTLSFVGPADG